EVPPDGGAAEGEEHVRHALARDAGVAADEEREDRGRDERLEDDPPGADDRLLVAHLELARDERRLDLPKLPELAERRPREAARRAVGRPPARASRGARRFSSCFRRARRPSTAGFRWIAGSRGSA